MAEEEKHLEVTAEEQKAEAEALQKVEADELKDKLAEEMGLDPEEQAELLEKIVQRELANRERLSGAIKQKRKWREQAQGLSKKPDEKTQDGKTQTNDVPDIDKLVEQKFSQLMEKKELESIELNDELKQEVQNLARLKGISVREALKDPYIQFKKQELDKQERIERNTPKRTAKGSAAPHVDLTKPLDPKDFNLDTEEGVKAWKQAREEQAKLRAGA